MTIAEGHDRAAKRLLGDARTMADALRAFVPGGWTADLDLGTRRPLPADHMDAARGGSGRDASGHGAANGPSAPLGRCRMKAAFTGVFWQLEVCQCPYARCPLT